MMALLAVLLSMELLLWVVLFFEGIPIKTPLEGQILFEWLKVFQPEREIFFYRVFILSSVFLFALFGLLARRYKAAFCEHIKPLLIWQGLCVLGLGWLCFKLLNGADNSLVRSILMGSMVLSLAGKLLIIPAQPLLRQGWQWLNHPMVERLWATVGVGVALLVIFVILWIPRPEIIVAQMFLGEQAHHMSGVLAGPVWAAHEGLRPNVDFSSQYGVGMPVVLARVLELMGRVDYEGIVKVLMHMTIIYYMLFFVFLKRVLVSTSLCLAAILLGIKWQMFHTGMYPLIYILPNGLPMRFFWDVIVFLGLSLYLSRGQHYYLAGASVAAGFAMVSLFDTGLYLGVTYLAVIAVLAYDKFRAKQRVLSSILFFAQQISLVTAAVFLFLLLILKEGLWQGGFVEKSTEFLKFWLSGYEVLPMSHSLTQKAFLQTLMALIIPAVYLLNLLITTAQYLLKERPLARLIWPWLMSVYGLGLFHYYVVRSVSTQYDVASLPFVFILAFWAKQGLERFPLKTARALRLSILGIIAMCLVTTHMFLIYPNMLNLSKNPATDPVTRPRLPGGKDYFHHLFVTFPEPWKLSVNSLGERDERLVREGQFLSDEMLLAYYRREYDFKQDADLIAQWVPRGAKAAVFSSFDIKLLMQANRAPYFYYFPFLVDRPMRMRNFPSTLLHNRSRQARVLKQLQEDPPEYVFMERIFLTREVPREYLYLYADFLPLLEYIINHYQPAATGQYLVAMKKVL